MLFIGSYTKFIARILLRSKNDRPRYNLFPILQACIFILCNGHLVVSRASKKDISSLELIITSMFIFFFVCNQAFTSWEDITGLLSLEQQNA